MTTEEPTPSKEKEEEDLQKLRSKPVTFTRVNEEKLNQREGGEDFTGNLSEFDMAFEWVWVDEETKVLADKKNNEPFTGLIHIKDDKLDPKTYPKQEQKVNFEEGKVKFIDSKAVEDS